MKDTVMDKRIDMTKVQEVIQMRLQGMTFREIAGRMDKDIRQIYRWASYARDNLHRI